MRVLSVDEVRARARALAVPWRAGDDLAWREVVRVQLAAEGVTTRRALVDRALRWADAPRDDEDRTRLSELIDDLDAVGDLSLGDEGLVAATAPRAAVVNGGDTVLLLGTVPTPHFEHALGLRVEPRRVRRVILPRMDLPALTDAMATLGGRVVDALRWAGLDRAPTSPTQWWAELNARDPLDETAGSEWEITEVQRLVVGDGRARWRDEPRGDGLLRRRMDGGWHRFAVRRDGCLWALSRDEATRTELSLRWEGGALPTMAVRAEAGGVRFTLGARIPMAEYRLLLGTADRVDGATWDVPRATWPALASVFRERLGCALDESALMRGDPA